MKQKGYTTSDKKLVSDALANGPEAFGPIVEKYKEAVFAIALVRLRNFHDAEDLTQSTFLDAFERLDRLNDPNRLGAWLRSMVIHRCLNFIRQRTKTNEVMQQAVVQHATPQDQMNGAAIRKQVFEALDQLSKVQRETVTMFYISGYAQEEIANIQEVPVGTVKWRLHEARKKLKAEMVPMVKEILKKEAPKEDFSKRVYDLLNGYPRPQFPWREAINELDRIGSQGFEGYIKAFETPHAKTRARALHMMLHTQMDKKEAVIDMLKKGLGDSSQRVRRHSIMALLSMDVSDDRKRQEFLPLIWPLFLDPSYHVRRWLSIRWVMEQWAADIPLETLCEAIREEEHEKIRNRFYYLLRRAVEEQFLENKEKMEVVKDGRT